LEAPTVGEGFNTVSVELPTGTSINEVILDEFAKSVTGNDWPATCTVAPCKNPEPVIVTKVWFPAKRLEGVTEETMGGGFWSVRGKTFETPADGEGF
jgi:hypothetical protein